MIIKQQKICDVNDCYKSISFITEEFVSNKVLWTCEKHRNLLNRLLALLVKKLQIFVKKILIEKYNFN
ncbi:hypothetical protein D6D54_04835 [Spiroplasma poulsonii]|uniref:Uncharacterized protein n=1 Tax=Spiroplasma poulsonii TaxID=2138 RepID=A0A433ER62_9MOLU|nr:hypothetical protein [Spiroplasma poulsonii]MBW3057653.1 hypothetical protein [Spiroplasma poulsonii]RUP77033.1 hypothetical protein D6D54_04835 [Spiroplasma poulsonii]